MIQMARLGDFAPFMPDGGRPPFTYTDGIPRVTVPLVMVGGGADPIREDRLRAAVFDRVSSEYKRFILLPGAGHVDQLYLMDFEDIFGWLEERALGKARGSRPSRKPLFQNRVYSSGRDLANQAAEAGADRTGVSLTYGPGYRPGAARRHSNATLIPATPERGRIPARVLGYGEISTVFEIGDESQRDLAYKRMPIFVDEAELAQYVKSYDEYNRLFTEKVGLRMPPYGHASFLMPDGRPIIFLAQHKLDPDSIGNRVVHLLPPEEVPRLIRQVLRELAKVWRYNRAQERIEMGIDGQISNWSVAGFDGTNPRLGEKIELLYFDTSTPLYRVDGVDQLDPELFLRSAPSFLVARCAGSSSRTWSPATSTSTWWPSTSSATSTRSRCPNSFPA